MNSHTIGDQIQAYERRIRELENKVFTLEVENRQLKQAYVRANENEALIMQCHENLKSSRS